MIGKIILAITGIGAGFIISAGVFAFITSTGIITRFADKTHTAKSIQLYETIVIAGGILWNYTLSLHDALPISEERRVGKECKIGSPADGFMPAKR